MPKYIMYNQKRPEIFRIIMRKELMYMDIAALSTSMAMTDVANQASIRVLSMSLDDLETSGDGLRKMMEMSVNPGLGANIDVSV